MFIELQKICYFSLGDNKIIAAGFIQFPLMGRVQAAGLTLGELEDVLQARLSESFVVNPRVAVNIMEYSPIFVLGDVAVPGSYPYQPGMTVVHAVALAGGYGVNEAIEEELRPLGARKEGREP